MNQVPYQVLQLVPGASGGDCMLYGDQYLLECVLVRIAYINQRFLYWAHRAFDGVGTAHARCGD